MKLRGQMSSLTSSLDVSSDSSTRLQNFSSSSLDATDCSSHSSLYVKENKNLHKVYATLSSKLFDEMERTDSLFSDSDMQIGGIKFKNRIIRWIR